MPVKRRINFSDVWLNDAEKVAWVGPFLSAVIITCGEQLEKNPIKLTKRMSVHRRMFLFFNDRFLVIIISILPFG